VVLLPERSTSGHYGPIYHVDIRFVRSKSFLPKPTSSLEKLRFYVGRCGKEYEFSLIKAVVSVYGVGRAFPGSIGIDAVRLSAGN